MAEKKSDGEPVDPAVQAARITRRGTVATAVIAALAALAAAVIGAYATGRKQGADAATPSTVTVVQTVTVTATGTSGETEAANPGVPAQIRLDAGTGADLDVADPGAVAATGPTGELDLHFGENSLTATGSALHHYNGAESEAATECPKVVSAGRSTAGPVVPSVGGAPFCFRTSEGAIGWFTINSAEVNSGPPANFVVLDYLVFD